MDTRSSARNKATSSNLSAPTASRTTKMKVTVKSTNPSKPAPTGMKRTAIPRKPLSSRSNSSFVSNGSQKTNPKPASACKDARTHSTQSEDHEPITVEILKLVTKNIDEQNLRLIYDFALKLGMRNLLLHPT